MRFFSFNNNLKIGEHKNYMVELLLGRIIMILPLCPKLIDSLSFLCGKPHFLVFSRGGFLDFVWIIFLSSLTVAAFLGVVGTSNLKTRGLSLKVLWTR